MGTLGLSTCLNYGKLKHRGKKLKRNENEENFNGMVGSYFFKKRLLKIAFENTYHYFDVL